jgi:hypothetical protein
MTPVDELELHASILELIMRRRSETGDENLGSAIEERIIARTLRGVEEEILSNPGALEAHLVRRRS